MIKKRVPKEFWNYGMKWVLEISSLTHITVGTRGLDGYIPLAQVTGNSPNISEYLNFGFYDTVWFKNNAGSSPFEPGQWLGVAHRTGRLLCHHILN